MVLEENGVQYPLTAGLLAENYVAMIVFGRGSQVPTIERSWVPGLMAVGAFVYLYLAS